MIPTGGVVPSALSRDDGRTQSETVMDYRNNVEKLRQDWRDEAAIAELASMEMAA